MSTLRAFLAAITALANAYAAKLAQDAPLARYRAQLSIAADIEQLEDEIAALRLGDAAANLRADILRDRLLARQGIAAGLSAANPAPGSAAGDRHA